MGMGSFASLRITAGKNWWFAKGGGNLNLSGHQGDGKTRSTTKDTEDTKEMSPQRHRDWVGEKQLS
jgi:hypothetical protein